MKTLINKIKTYIKHKIHNIKMMFKLFRNAWKLNSIITWYEQYQTIPNQIRDIKDNICDIDSKCDDNYYKIEDIENQSISRRLDDIDDEVEKLQELHKLRVIICNNQSYIEGLQDEVKKLKSSTLGQLVEHLKSSENYREIWKTSDDITITLEKNNDDDNYLYKPLKFKGNEGYYEWLKNKTNYDNLDKCSEEIVKFIETLYGGEINGMRIKNIISRYINLSKKGGE